jgi:hypothetical protein
MGQMIQKATNKSTGGTERDVNKDSCKAEEVEDDSGWWVKISRGDYKAPKLSYDGRDTITL